MVLDGNFHNTYTIYLICNNRVDKNGNMIDRKGVLYDDIVVYVKVIVVYNIVDNIFRGIYEIKGHYGNVFIEMDYLDKDSLLENFSVIYVNF